MSYTPTVQDFELLKHHSKKQLVKLTFLDRHTFIPYGDIQGRLLDYSLDIDSTSDYRRTLSLDLNINKTDLILFEKNAVLLNRVLRVYIGLSDNRGEVHWYLIGTFAFTEKSYTYNAAEDRVSINCVDMTAYLNGDLGGRVTGVNSVNIYAYQDNLRYSMIKSLYQEGDITPYATYFSPNSKITLPLPSIWDSAYAPDVTLHSCGHKNNGNIGNYGGLIIVILKDNDIKNGCDVLNILDVQCNRNVNVKVEETDTHKYCAYPLGDNSGSEIIITALMGVTVERIEVYDYYVSDYHPIVIWNFGSEYEFSDELSSIYPVEQICHTFNVLGAEFTNQSNTLLDIELKDERFLQYGTDVVINEKHERSSYRGYNYDYKTNNAEGYYVVQPMIAVIDTLEGRQISIKEVVSALLDKAGISKYNIDDITEIIPFNQEFSSDITYFEIIRQLASLYEDIEVFFDVDGTFVMKHIPTTEESPCVLTNDILQPLIIEETCIEDLTSFYNVTEIWGSQINADYYTANSDEFTAVKYNEELNYIEAVYDNIATTDNGKIIDGTIISLLTPDNITNHPANISISVNNMGSTTVDTTDINVTKIWQLDDELYWHYLTPSTTVLETNGVPYRDVVFYGFPSYRDDGSLRYYFSSFDTKIADKIDGINFSYRPKPSPGTFGNSGCEALYFARPNYIYDEANGIRKLDVSNLINCIQFKAKKGEVVRFYFTQQSALSVADVNGNILSHQISSTNTTYKINYMDFFPLSTTNDTYYVFDGITVGTTNTPNSDCVAFLGMSRFIYDCSTLLIKDMYTDEMLPQGFLKPNTSYCFQYSHDIFWYLGQWQVHAVAIEMKEPPNSNDEFIKQYNCSNIVYTSYNPSIALDVIGEKAQSLKGSDYENIYADGLALQRADWENWKSVHTKISLSLKTLCIPWLEVNTKHSYCQNGDVERTYFLNKINIDSNGLMDLSLSSFTPRYKKINGYILKDYISTEGMVNLLPADNTMFSNSLYNYKLFDYKYYANKYSDLKNKYGYNVLQLWNHWCQHGICEGRRCSKVYDPNVYTNYSVFVSEQNTYINKIKSAFGSNYTNNNGYKYMAMYLHFLDKGINDYEVICSDEFNIKVYAAYKDLKAKYGNEWRRYYEYYIKYDYVENRVCI